MKNYSINSDARTKVDRIIFALSSIITIFITIFYNRITISWPDTNVFYAYFNLFLVPSFGGIYFFLKYIFNHFLWNKKIFKKIIKVPDLSGEWSILGKNNSDNSYTGTLIIKQNFTKISIRGIFDKSNSFNEETYLNFDDLVSLSYHYKNEPIQNNENNLKIHCGYVKISFSEDFKTANGEYFTDGFRQNYGNWTLEKKNK